MTENAKFQADVGDWADRALDQLLRVAKQSTQDVIRDAQTPVAQGGNMPVDLGFLRNSIVSSIEGGASIGGEDAISLTISQLQLGDVINFEWTADYAVPRHYMVGVGQGGGLWRDIAAAKWQDIVAKNARAVT